MSIDINPCPRFLLEPTLDLAERVSKRRIAPMIRDTEVLSKIIGTPRSRDADNTILNKTFRGGALTISGANSPSAKAKNTRAAWSGLLAFLRVAEPGPGYSHFPVAYEIDYFQQLSSEQVRTKYKNGRPLRYWFKPAGVRNEALDRRVVLGHRSTALSNCPHCSVTLR